MISLSKGQDWSSLPKALSAAAAAATLHAGKADIVEQGLPKVADVCFCGLESLRLPSFTKSPCFEKERQR